MFIISLLLLFIWVLTHINITSTISLVRDFTPSNYYINFPIYRNSQIYAFKIPTITYTQIKGWIFTNIFC